MLKHSNSSKYEDFQIFCVDSESEYFGVLENKQFVNFTFYRQQTLYDLNLLTVHTKWNSSLSSIRKTVSMLLIIHILLPPPLS